MNQNDILETLISEVWNLVGTMLEDIVTTYNITLNFHDVAGISQVNPTSLKVTAPYAYHNNDFCNQVKTKPKYFHQCVKQKAKVIQHAEKYLKPFYGECYMGYGEYIFPICKCNKLLAVICIGHMSPDIISSKAFVEDIQKLVLIIEKAFDEYRSLIKDENIYIPNESNLRNQHIVTATLKFIKVNYAQNLSLKLLAEHCYTNPSYLSTKFKEQLGIGINDYINRIRIAEATYQLTSSSASITEIATNIGYNDPAYFSRIFKKLEGVSPKKYRHNLIEHKSSL